MATILILEDDLDLSSQWQMILEDEGYRVLTATRGDIAKSIMKIETVDLVLADIFIKDDEQYVPDGGISLLGHLRIEGRKPDGEPVPVIIVSGSNMRLGVGVELFQTAKDLGAVATLRKPIDADELIEAVQKHL